MTTLPPSQQTPGDLPLYRRPFWLFILLLAVVLCLGTLYLLDRANKGGILGPQATDLTPETWYVSRTAAAGGNGTSWDRAWNELNAINWSVVGPNDTIEIDGGATACPAFGDEWSGAASPTSPPCGMVYNTGMVVGISGVSSVNFLTIKLSDDAGRNGTVIMEGNNNNYTYCSENATVPMSSPPHSVSGTARGNVLDLGARNWIVVDGTHWGGIVVRNGRQYGVTNFGDDVVLRYVKSHHNNEPADTTNSSNGINLQNQNADRVTLEYLEVYRNGQDALRMAADDATLRYSFIHDTYCNHPDGIQSLVFTSNSGVGYSEQVVENLRVESNIFHNVDLQSVFVGENNNCAPPTTNMQPAARSGYHCTWNDGTRVINNLFTTNAPVPTRYYLKTKHQKSTNFIVERNTFHFSTEYGIEWCCGGATAPMIVRDNIFYEINAGASALGFFMYSGQTSYTGNCRSASGGMTGQFTSSGEITSSPGFANANRSPTTGDYTPSGACASKGSTIINRAALQALGVTAGGAAPPTPTPIIPATSTASPTNTPGGPTNTPLPTNTATRTATPAATGLATLTQTPTPTRTATVTPVSSATPGPTQTPQVVWNGQCFILYRNGEPIGISCP